MVENNAEYTQWQVLLTKVEKDLTEHEARGLELRRVKNYIKKQMGLPTEEIADATFSETGVGTHTGILPKFRKGDFYGFSQAKAGYRVLQAAGGSLNIDEILRVLTESGYSVGGEDPRRTLYSSLCRSRRLVLVAPYAFDLAERRPKARKTKEPKSEEAEKGKALKEQTQTAPETKEEMESN